METQLANYILSILKSNPFIVMTWGAHNFRAVEEGLSFDVEGFIYSGKVEIIYNEGLDLFEIWIYNDGERTLAMDDVYADQIIEVVDRLVEKDCSQREYEAKVRDAYYV